MWLVGKEIIGQSRPYPAPVCYGGTGTGSRAKPVLIRFPSAVEPVSHYDCGVNGDRQSSQQRVVETPGANGLHGRSAVPIAWRWGPIVVWPAVFPGGGAIMRVCECLGRVAPPLVPPLLPQRRQWPSNINASYQITDLVGALSRRKVQGTCIVIDAHSRVPGSGPVFLRSRQSAGRLTRIALPQSAPAGNHLLSRRRTASLRAGEKVGA